MAITSETPTIATRLEDDDREWIEQQARKNDRSVAAELRQIVKQHRRHSEAMRKMKADLEVSA